MMIVNEDEDDKKDEVERMTVEDFVESVVSHAEVKDGNGNDDW